MTVSSSIYSLRWHLQSRGRKSAFCELFLTDIRPMSKYWTTHTMYELHDFMGHLDDVFSSDIIVIIFGFKVVFQTLLGSHYAALCPRFYSVMLRVNFEQTHVCRQQCSAWSCPACRQEPASPPTSNMPLPNRHHPLVPLVYANSVSIFSSHPQLPLHLGVFAVES